MVTGDLLQLSLEYPALTGGECAGPFGFRELELHGQSPESLATFDPTALRMAELEEYLPQSIPFTSTAASDLWNGLLGESMGSAPIFASASSDCFASTTSAVEEEHLDFDSWLQPERGADASEMDAYQRGLDITMARNN